MNVIKADIARPLLLGRQGEHGATQVVFDLSGYIRTYGDGVAQLVVKRPGDPLEYAAVLTQEDDKAMWDIGPEWTQNAGQGYCYLHWFVDDDHVKSDTFKTLVRESKSACVDAPEPQTGYLDQVLAAGAKAGKAAEGAEKSAAEVMIIAKRFDTEFTKAIEKAAGSANTAADAANQSATNAATSEKSAGLHRGEAENAAGRAADSERQALAAAGRSETAAGNAEVDRSAAQEAAVNAQASAGSAAASEQAAAEHRAKTELIARQGGTAYSNALKGTASGENIRLGDVSPLEHTVPVRVRSKNLVDLSEVIPYYQEDVTVDRDAVKIAAGTSGYGIVLGGVALGVGKTYTFSFASLTGLDLTTYKDYGFELKFADGTTSILSGYTANPNPHTMTINKEVSKVRFRIGYGATIEQDIEIVGLQITESVELKTVTVADADGAQTATYTVAEDGTCEVTSITPVMVMTTNSDSLVMDCEYNRDIKTLMDFVTPEMFGAVGNGVTDDAVAIQRAINTGRKCVLKNRYAIKSTLHIPSDAVLTVDGELIVSCAIGIVLNGSNTVIDGNGKITTDKTTADVICIRRYINGADAKNVIISVNRIVSRRFYSNTAIEITGGPEYAGGCYDKITSAIMGFAYGIVSRVSETQDENSWYTALTIDALIENCRQAIRIDWGGSGFLIHGQIQPVLTSAVSTYDAELPLVKLPRRAYMDAFIWDMGAAINKYAIDVPFEACTIITHLNNSFIKLNVNSYPVEIIRPSRSHHFLFATQSSDAPEDFDNTNDILLNADKNPAVIATLPPITNIEKVLAGTGDYVYLPAGYFGGVHTFEFEFAREQHIRAVALFGTQLPEEVSFEVSLDGAEYISLSTQKAGEDFKNTAGADRCVYWDYDYYRDVTTLGDYYERKIKKLRISMTLDAEKPYNLTRLCAFTYAADIMKRSGGQFEGDISFASGAGCVLTAPNGVKYRLVVDETGALSTEKLS